LLDKQYVYLSLQEKISTFYRILSTEGPTTYELAVKSIGSMFKVFWFFR